MKHATTCICTPLITFSCLVCTMYHPAEPLLHKAIYNKNYYQIVSLINRESVHEKGFQDMTALHAVLVNELDRKIELVNKLLENGADPNAKTNFFGGSQSPLHYCATYGVSVAITLLAKYGADINQKDCDGYSPLCTAIQHNDIFAIYALLKLGAPVNPNDNDVLPLCVAANRSFVDIVRLLLEHGALVNRKDRFGMTPLHYAAVNCNKEMISLLRSQGAYLDVETHKGKRPFDLAVATWKKENEWRHKYRYSSTKAKRHCRNLRQIADSLNDKEISACEQMRRKIMFLTGLHYRCGANSPMMHYLLNQGNVYVMKLICECLKS